jgi:protein tyrosine/serine phosphatase
MHRSKVLSAFLAVLLLLTGLAACTGKQPHALSVDGLGVIHESEFGGVYLMMTIDDFNARGFCYGDSVTVTFSNGYTMDDLPYFSGYYVNVNEPLLVAYPGYDYIKAAINYGKDVWEFAGLDESMTAAVTLKEHGKYLDIQEASDIHYLDEREKYPSDAVFANFRVVNAGRLRENVLYRSASPCDNQHNRAPYVDALIGDAGVNCVVNLADNEAKVQKYIAADDFRSPYWLSLYEGGHVILLSMSMNFQADDFKMKICEGLRAMSAQEGPYLVHCTEGKDRTGFMCMLLEALAGASYRELVDDYMLTYDNYYQITERSDKAKYDTILDRNLVAMIRYIVNDDSVDVTTADLSVYARKFLLSIGMADAEIDALLDRLTD